VVIVKPVLNQYMKLMFWHLVQTGPRYPALLRKIPTSLALLSEPQLALQGKSCQMWTSFWSHCRYSSIIFPDGMIQLCLCSHRPFRYYIGFSALSQLLCATPLWTKQVSASMIHMNNNPNTNSNLFYPVERHPPRGTHYQSPFLSWHERVCKGSLAVILLSYYIILLPRI